MVGKDWHGSRPWHIHAQSVPICHSNAHRTKQNSLARDARYKEDQDGAGPQEDHASVDILGRTTREDRIPAAHMYYSANARHSETIVWGQRGIMSGEEVNYTVLVMSMP